MKAEKFYKYTIEQVANFITLWETKLPLEDRKQLNFDDELSRGLFMASIVRMMMTSYRLGRKRERKFRSYRVRKSFNIKNENIKRKKSTTIG